ncbi:MAG TPA: hypothetical protein VK024_09975, partial [Actinomycetaceae bacterium]|nr:hypothetical protein [Actinomycetaceae bacterium]
MVTLACAVYVLVLARSWHEHATDLDATAHELGLELATTRAELDTTQNALHSVEDQLSDAQLRIIELADTVAQTGDD